MDLDFDDRRGTDGNHNYIVYGLTIGSRLPDTPPRTTRD